MIFFFIIWSSITSYRHFLILVLICLSLIKYNQTDHKTIDNYSKKLFCPLKINFPAFYFCELFNNNVIVYIFTHTRLFKIITKSKSLSNNIVVLTYIFIFFSLEDF